jgi:hypothetical protein
MQRIAIESVCHNERAGAATTFGEPGVPICKGASASMCITACSLIEILGTAPKPETNAGTAIAIN